MTLPKHIAIVMDGNGRWAKQRHLPRFVGHQKGANALESIISACVEKKIEILTVFTFSKENWERPKSEIRFLMRLFLESIQKSASKLNDNQVCVCHLGDKEGFPKPLQKALTDLEHLTRNNTGLRLVIAANYSGKWDIVEATKRITIEVLAGRQDPTQIDERCFEQYLMTHWPAPDLLIRTSGELRLSNFMLWQMAYTEFYFCDTLWPDFNNIEFERALNAYAHRDRRFGKILQPSEKA